MKTVIPVVLQPSTKEYFWANAVLEGIKTAAARYSCEWQIIDPESDEQLKAFNGSPVIISGHSSVWLLSIADMLSSKGLIPIITNASIPTLPKSRYSGVCFDLKSGMEETVDCCTENGKKVIALLGVRKNSAADKDKISCFCEIMARKGLTDAHIYYFEDSTEKALDGFVAGLSGYGIDAVICANDTVGFFLLEKLKTKGIKVPDDVFVLGMGGFAINSILEKPLTSLSFDYAELGLQAVRLWRYFLKDGGDINITVSVACKLIHRSTSIKPCQTKKPLPIVTTANPDDLAGSFFEEHKVNTFLKLEAMLCDFDELDYKLLKFIASSTPDEVMAEKVRLTPRAIRYRISKMLKKMDVKSRNALIKILKEYNIFCEV